MSMLLGLCAWSSVGVTCRDAALATFGQHRGVFDAQVLADAGEGPAEMVQVDGVIGLLEGQAPAAHRHLVPVQDLADRSPLDAEPGTQLVHRLSTFISGDEFLDLIGAELAGPAEFGSTGGRWGGCGGVGKLPAQGFQGVYLHFRVVVSSPKVHQEFVFYALTCFFNAEAPLRNNVDRSVSAVQ